MGATASTVYTYANPAKNNEPTTSLALSSRSSWVATFARASILNVLRTAIQVGYLTIEDNEGKHAFGHFSAGCKQVQMKVNSDDFWTRVFLTGDLGFSEAYMIGDVDVSDLRACIHLFLDNQDGISGVSSLSKLTTAISGVSNALFRHSKTESRLSVIASYDQSNELFKAFLSKEMMYSCALWDDAEGGVRGDLVSGPTPGDLEAAQARKINHVLKKARVKPGDRILEFGSGWGGMSIAAAKMGCEVDTLTLSVEQKALAEERVREAGLEGRVRVHLMDYRDIPAHFEKAFDAFISIEMLEHVGAKFYETYFRLVDFALKSENATIVCSASSFPESRYGQYQGEDFMRKYMWPNCHLPSATALVEGCHKGAQARFTLESIENHAAHYPRTLREWGRRLEKNLTQEIIAKDYPSLNNPHEYEAFKRKWQYLFAYAGSGFAHGYLTCHMWTFHRQSDKPVACD